MNYIRVVFVSVVLYITLAPPPKRGPLKIHSDSEGVTRHSLSNIYIIWH